MGSMKDYDKKLISLIKLELENSNNNEARDKIRAIKELMEAINDKSNIMMNNADKFSNKIQDEPLLTPNPIDKYVIGLNDVKYPDVKEFYDKQIRSFWVSDEIDLAQDLKDWNELTDDERHFIKYVLCFFASSDSIIGENLNTRFLYDIQNQSIKQFLLFQGAMESIHQEVYNLMITTYIKDPNELDEIFSSIINTPFIKKKIDWILKWMSDETKTFHERLVAFACAEGILFSGSFCAIFWIKSKQKMPGLCLSNEFIARDEGMHSQFSCLIYRKYLLNKLKYEIVDEIITSALEVERDFICGSLPVELIGMNSDLMYKYLQFVADTIYVMLGYEKKYKVNNPFPFMDAISLDVKTNFFESRNSTYQKLCDIKKPLNLVEDF